MQCLRGKGQPLWTLQIRFERHTAAAVFLSGHIGTEWFTCWHWRPTRNLSCWLDCRKMVSIKKTRTPSEQFCSRWGQLERVPSGYLLVEKFIKKACCCYHSYWGREISGSILFQTVLNIKKYYVSLISKYDFFLRFSIFVIGMHLIINGILVLCHSLSAFYIMQWDTPSWIVLQLLAS